MIPPPRESHRVTVSEIEEKPWWVFWRAPKVLRSYEDDCYCDMAAFWRAAAQDKED